MIKDIAFTAYSVSDIARARQFYENVLGLKPTQTTSEFWQEYNVGNGTFGIGHIPEGSPTEALYKNRASSVVFEVEDLDAALEKMKRCNVPMIHGPTDHPGCRAFVITDPDNNVITLHQLKP